MEIMIITDGHGTIYPEDIQDFLNQNTKPDLVCLLGDLEAKDLRSIVNNQILQYVPMMGIPGNHDQLGLLEQFGIPNIHGRIAEYQGIRFGALGGSVRYKNTDSVLLLSQREACTILEAMPPCDILLTHSNPGEEGVYLGENFSRINAHDGLIAITEYVERNNTPLLIHGHVHESYEQKIGNTAVKSCYLMEMIDTSNYLQK